MSVAADNVVSLDAYRRGRPSRPIAPAAARRPPRAVFCFDVASPWTYLAAERVERLFAEADWEPVDAGRVGAGLEVGRGAHARATARALELRLPLVWPERPGGVPVRRASAYAAHHGRATEFALAAGRLAFCGGYGLDEPDVIAEAAAAAGLTPALAVTAAADPGWDDVLAASSARLDARAPDALPALWVGDTLVCGEDRLAAAVSRAAS